MPDSTSDAAPGSFLGPFLDSFTDALASSAPAPAAGSAAAVSGRLAVSLLIKILRITASRKTFSGDKASFSELEISAQEISRLLARVAEQDGITFGVYLDRVRAKASLALRDEAMLGAIEIPLSAARAIIRALNIGAESAAFVPSFLVADLAAVIHLLAGAVPALLVTVDYNLGQLSVTQPHIAEERADLERQARERAAAIFDKLHPAAKS